GRLQQLLQLGGRQDVVDLDRRHPDSIGHFTTKHVSNPSWLYSGRDSGMHGNGCYVNRASPPCWTKEFAEPVSLSSTALVDFPLAGTVLEFGFDLLGLRARRKWESRAWARPVQDLPHTSRPQFAEIQFSTFPQQTVQLVENRNAPGDKVRAVSHLRPPSTAHGVISFIWGLFFGVFIWL